MNMTRTTTLIATLVILTSIIGVNMAHALESNTEYFIDSKNAFVIISLDSSGKTTLLDGGMIVNGEWELWETSNLKLSRILNDGELGRFFGRSEAGNLFYGKYDILGDQAQLMIKIWHDGIKTKIIEKATVSDLFN